MISYEFPLNERVRTLLRLEDLYEKVDFFASKTDPQEHHAAVLTLFEILDVAGRADLKSELMQELERQRHNLEGLRSNPAISTAALDAVLSEMDRASSGLFQASGKTGQELRDNEWLMGVRQRAGIPGGVSEFDLPSYYFWLHMDADRRRTDIAKWLEPFLPMKEGIRIVLKLLRESGKSSTVMAQHGVFQQMMGGRLAQMLRIVFDETQGCVPEVSANKYALNIRFTQAQGTERGRTHEGDVSFDLTFCNL
ncbi:MAG: cell division protein ZapD [Burkholderiales bacterium]|nr:cell division protein ZapD [Burkholderiales bacterium]